MRYSNDFRSKVINIYKTSKYRKKALATKFEITRATLDLWIKQDQIGKLLIPYKHNPSYLQKVDYQNQSQNSDSLLAISLIKQSLIIVSLVVISPSTFLYKRLHFSSHAKDLSTTHHSVQETHGLI